MIHLERLDHFGVDVTDLERAERFYTDVLGMSVVMRLPDQRLLRYAGGNCALFLKPDRERGGIPYHAPIDWGDHHCLYFLDPDGNLLELVGYRAPR
jgi:catechol 2,3-dioxygenase-like lactoylglutathione lyase family enzyme